MILLWAVSQDCLHFIGTLVVQTFDKILHDGQHFFLVEFFITANDLKATIDYTSFLEKISRDPTATAAEVVAAMVPCMTLYAILGKRLEKAGVEDDNPYREWVETYASDEFWEAKEQAEGLLDVLTPHGCERCGDLYAEAMRLEHSFFAAQDVAPDWIRLTSPFRARLEASLSGASLRAGAEMEL